jgi:carbamoylphosphate synthase large subunit
VGLNGLHDIDLMTDSLGRPALLEVNPRMSGSVSASHAAGFPVVAAAIAELLGISYPMLSPTKDIEIGLISRGVLLHKSYE